MNVIALKKVQSKNHAKGFLDLSTANPEVRKKRAEELAARWVKKIQEKFKCDLDDIARGVFRQEVQQGRRIKTEDLQRLNTTWR